MKEDWDTIKVPLADGSLAEVQMRNLTPADPSQVEFGPLPPAVAEEYEIRIVPSPFLLKKRSL